MRNTNLYLPFYSQRDVNYEWHYRIEDDNGITIKEKHYKKGEIHPDDSSYKCCIADGCCNITCLAMVLNYLGVTTDGPEQIAQKVFATDVESTNEDFDRYIKYRKMGSYGPTEGSGCIESPYVLQAIAKDIYNVRNTYCANNYSLEDVKKEVAAGTTEMLTGGTIIQFKPGADKHAFDKGGQKHRYEVIKINSESCTGEVELTLEDKKKCDDSKFPQNYSNYAEIDKSVTNKNDKKALSIYRQSNGVPYYMNGMDANNNKGARKLRSDEILNWSEQEKNWYSYERKPNTGDFGIDCSGFVSNCLTAFCYENKEKHFLNLNSYFQNYVRATSIRDSLCREIPITENTKGLSYLQKGDIVVSSRHIAFSYEINLDSHLAMDKIVGINKNYFTILQANGNSLESNDDNKDTEASCLYLTTPPNKYTEGFFLRILKGPFRHWGKNIKLEKDSNSIGKVQLRRIYLWY